MIFLATQKLPGLGWDPLPLYSSLLIFVKIQHQSSEYNMTVPPSCNDNLHSHGEPREESAPILVASSELIWL